jgi:hypothetical protein
MFFNDDGAETAVLMTEPTAENFLAPRLAPLAGKKIDAIFYCTRSSGFGMFTHFTKVGQVFTTLEGRYKNNQTPAMLKAGIDPLTVTVDFAKKNGMEIFWSMRMNDTHDGSRAEYGPITFRANRLKNAHPEYLLGTAKKRPKIGSWTAVDYGRPEIRELAFRYFEEVCQNYDVDGVELDFFRHPVYFKSTSRGELATDEELAAMTDLVRRIRKMTQKEAHKRDRPILVAVHCPDSAEYSRAMGLDLERWMQEGLFDLWIAGGTFQFNDWDYSVELARKHGVKVYPSLDNPRVKDELAVKMRGTPKAYRARAASVWGVGADGVNIFNAADVFDIAKESSRATPEDSLWNQLADPQRLAALDRDYFASPLGAVNSSAGNYPMAPFQNAETLNGRSPKKIAPGGKAKAGMFVGDDLSMAGEPKLKLRLRFKSPPKQELLEIKFNDQSLRSDRIDEQWAEFAVSPSAVRRGRNEIQATLAEGAKSPLVWTDALLEVRY